MSMSAYETYQNDLFYLTKVIKTITLDLEHICADAELANIPWETRKDLMDRIDSVLRSSHCNVPQPTYGHLVQLRELLASLPAAVWSIHIDTVDLCTLTFGTPEWGQVRDACGRLLPALTAACAEVGMANYL